MYAQTNVVSSNRKDCQYDKRKTPRPSESILKSPKQRGDSSLYAPAAQSVVDQGQPVASTAIAIEATLLSVHAFGVALILGMYVSSFSFFDEPIF